jgi:hypothetical protein
VGTFEGIVLRDYVPGYTYDVPSTIGNQLVEQGFAFVEIRKHTRSRRQRVERRRPLIAEPIPAKPLG